MRPIPNRPEDSTFCRAQFRPSSDFQRRTLFHPRWLVTLRLRLADEQEKGDWTQASWCGLECYQVGARGRVGLVVRLWGILKYETSSI
jgi:hypothetical protein